MKLNLLSKEDALKFIAQIGKGGEPFEISVGEDICFGRDKWINIGVITLQPEMDCSQIETRYDEYYAAKFGGFEWQLLSLENLNDNIFTNLDNNVQNKDKIAKAFREGLQDVLRRTLLLLPIFDVDTIAKIPLQKPITVVPDTSAVHQGGLDFVCRFLNPWARIKVPAIVHMEIVTQVDNYLSKIRWNDENKNKAKNNSATLRQHLLSQGGQRTLLRLELHSDAEIERGDLGSDPLRGIVTPSSDSEDKALGLQNVTRSFADRLILETARRFQTQVRPDHNLVLLTSDQGLARMTIAEGIDVFFFQARSVPKFDARKLTGTLSHPFIQKIYTVSLTDVLWELAVSFGCLRLYNPKTKDSLELWGIAGEEYSWQPLHIKDDLIWGNFRSEDFLITTDKTTTSLSTMIESVDQADAASSHNTETTAKGYVFSPDRMFFLMKILVETEELTNQEAQDKLGLKHQDRYNLYKNFLRSGLFVDVSDNKIICTGLLNSLWQSILDNDYIKVLEYLRKIPSFDAVYNHINQYRIVASEDITFPISNKAKPAYLKLGEVTCAWLNIQNKTVVSTDNKPDIPNFANLAVDVYQSIRSEGDTEWILTGLWLEELARKYAVHPILTRKLVKQAQKQNLLSVYAEGSTPDTRFEQNCLWILKINDGLPQLERIYLYHGDFLIPGTSAVRIKLEGVKNAS